MIPARFNDRGLGDGASSLDDWETLPASLLRGVVSREDKNL